MTGDRERRIVRKVPCAYCQAEVGQRCVNQADTAKGAVKVHRERALEYSAFVRVGNQEPGKGIGEYEQRTVSDWHPVEQDR